MPIQIPGSRSAPVSASVIGSKAIQGFLTSPIVIPHPRFLPDAWDGDVLLVIERRLEPDRMSERIG